ncbi:MAG: glycerate kinase [Verrucomicrobiota bacterium]
MARRVLIIPDKFKGTLSAKNAASAIARGWKKSHPEDAVELLPMCDGGEGFGEIISRCLGARSRKIKTVDAAHQSIETRWWWEPKTKTAVIESANIIGLAMLPPKKFHPFQLDTFGLGKVFRAAQKLGCRHCLIGIGGSATNDGGFGLARGLGWKFLDGDGKAIDEWTKLNSLATSLPPPARDAVRMKITVAVDVQNPLLGKRGATRVYGPQKGLRAKDFPRAEKALEQLAKIARKNLGADFAKRAGAGAAGGLGFGLMAFLQAKAESGFDIFSKSASLDRHLRKTDLVLTGEGALDEQTLMGKGVGQIALLCQKHKIPCVGIAGIVIDPPKSKKLFTAVHSLRQITSLRNAKMRAAEFLEKLAAEIPA